MTPDTNPSSALPPSVPEPPSGRFRGVAASIRQAILQARLVWGLLRDGRVPWFLKLIPVAGAAYFIFPLDFIPDIVPVLGQMDDLGILLGSVWLFVDLIPKAIVDEQWKKLVMGGKGSANPASSDKTARETVIDVSPKDPSSS